MPFIYRINKFTINQSMMLYEIVVMYCRVDVVYNIPGRYEKDWPGQIS